MRFIILGDSKGKKNGINEKVLTSLLKSTAKLSPSPDFIVICGDSVAGGKDLNTLFYQLNNFKNIIYKYHYNIKLIPVIGNHEVNINPIDDTHEKVFESFYDDMLPIDTCLDNYNRTVYYIDINNIRLIVLNSFHYNEIQKISDTQLHWLKSTTLNCNKKKLLFIHSPLFPTGAHLGHCLDLYPDQRNKLLSIIEECKIDLVICGHEHNYSRRLINSDNNKDLYQIITGGAGEKLRNKFKSKNRVIVSPIADFHYLLVDVYEDYLSILAINIHGKILDEVIIN